MTFTWRGLGAAFVVGAVLALALGWWMWCREPAAAPAAPEMIHQLERIGAVPETPEAPLPTHDLPIGTHVLEDISGHGDTGRTDAEQDAAADEIAHSAGVTGEVGNSEGKPAGDADSSIAHFKACVELVGKAITPEDLTVDCRSQVIESAPGYTVARIFGNASVRLPGGTRISRGCRPGKSCDPEGREALEDIRYGHEEATKVRRWDGELRAGVELRDILYDPHVAGRFGGSFYKVGKRIGGAFDVSRDITPSAFHPPDWSVTAMAAIDVGP